jgi:hypothetical protein
MLTKKCRTPRSARQRLHPQAADCQGLVVALGRAEAAAAIDLVAAPDLPGCVEPAFSEAFGR